MYAFLQAIVRDSPLAIQCYTFPCLSVAAEAGRRSGSLSRMGSERLSTDALFSTLLEGIGGWLYDREPQGLSTHQDSL